MLDGALLDKIEAVARAVRRDERPFGGVQVILCGDFFQLPPVSRTGEFRFAFEADCWSGVVGHTVELRTVYRQADPKFVAALSKVRLGEAPAHVERLLRARVGARLDESDGIVPTRLYTHRSDCARVNAERLAALGGGATNFSARDTSDSDEAMRLLRASCAAPDALALKARAQVVLIKTLDASRGLVNGARGIVLRISSTRLPIVRFESGVEQVVRCERFPLSQQGRTVACRTQLPLDLGWAISVHRSQGMTLDRVEVSLGRVFECGQMYVALSRARSLEGMSLVDLDLSRLRAHPKVLAFHQRVLGHDARGGPASEEEEEGGEELASTTELSRRLCLDADQPAKEAVEGGEGGQAAAAEVSFAELRRLAAEADDGEA